jgi:hypothetical protein
MFLPRTFPGFSRPAIPFASAGKARQVAVPSSRQLAALHLIDLGGELGKPGPVACEECLAAATGLRTTRTDPGGEVLAHPVRNEKLRILRPTIGTLGEADFLIAQRFAMGCRRILLMGRAIADVMPAHILWLGKSEPGTTRSGSLERIDECRS